MPTNQARELYLPHQRLSTLLTSVQMKPVTQRAWHLPLDAMPSIQGSALVAAGLLQVTHLLEEWCGKAGHVPHNLCFSMQVFLVWDTTWNAVQITATLQTVSL